MARPRETTPAARRYRLVLTAAGGVLAVAVFLPWCRVDGYPFTFYDADRLKALPVAELVVVGAAVVAGWVSLSRIKRIGRVAGVTVFACNVFGAVTAARLADVHNGSTYFRIQAAITLTPQWGAWVALVAGAVVVLGAMSNWPATLPAAVFPTTDHGPDDVVDGEDLALDIPLPHMDDVLGPPRLVQW